MSPPRSSSRSKTRAAASKSRAASGTRAGASGEAGNLDFMSKVSLKIDSAAPSPVGGPTGPPTPSETPASAVWEPARPSAETMPVCPYACSSLISQIIHISSLLKQFP